MYVFNRNTVTWLNAKHIDHIVWTCIVVITVFILKTRLHLFKFLCVVCLLIFYYSLYFWGINDWGLLLIIQKVNVINSTLLKPWGLHEFTVADLDGNLFRIFTISPLPNAKPDCPAFANNKWLNEQLL